MKKILAIILSISMLIGISVLLSSCKKEETVIDDKKDENNQEDIQIVGGWTKADSPVITNDIIELVKKATDAFAGASLEPVAYISSQVVAGTNHCILCIETATVPNAQSYYALVTIYEDLKGNAEVTEIVESDIKASTKESDGGWAKAQSPVIPNNLAEKINSAFNELTGADYEAIALLETQVVAGTNYSVLCKTTTVTPNSESKYTIAYIYVDLEGKASITDIKDFISDDNEKNADADEITAQYSNP